MIINLNFFYNRSEERRVGKEWRSESVEERKKEKEKGKRMRERERLENMN